MGDWIDTTLGDVAEFQRGFDLPVTERQPGVIPVIASTGVVDTHSEAKLPGPGVIIGRSGSIGGGQFVAGPYWPLNTTLWVKDFKGNDERFIYYLVRSLDLSRFNAGSSVPTLNRNHIHPLPIGVPADVHEQRAIASILGSLDDKIELNRRMNRTLEQMAAAIFKAWFVDFEPVRAKASGAASFPGMPQPVFDALPATFADSELGPIPEGWEVCDVYRLSDVVYGAPFKSKQFNGIGNGKPLIRIRDLQTHIPGVWTPEEHPKGTLVTSGDIVVGMDGEFRLHYWTGPQSWLNQRVCMFRPKLGVPKIYLGESLRPCLEFFERSKTGTTVIHLGKGDIDTFRLLLPTGTVLTAFREIAEPLLDLLVCNAAEVRTLAETRDALLPKLLSGEVRLASPSSPSDSAPIAPSIDQIMAMARLADELDSTPTPKWPELQRGGSHQAVMPVLDNGPAIERFEQQAYEHGFVIDFDWTGWQEQAGQYFSDPARLAKVDAHTVQRLVTTCVRKERFCEGTLASLHANGVLAAICRRLGQIAKESSK